MDMIGGKQGRVATLLALVVFGLLLSATAAEAATPSIRSCALGDLPRPLEGLVPTRIARAESRFVRGLGGLGSAERARARRTFAAAEAAYLYGFAPVATRLTVSRFPVNALIGLGFLSTPDLQAVVTPNADTLYSVSHVDLEGGPLVLDAPATEGRYSVLQLLDAYTNVIDNVGSGRQRDRAESVLLAGPGWSGEAPDGVRVIRSPTNLVWLLGRTLVDGQDDLAAATEVMSKYALTRLTDWQLGARAHEVVLGSIGSLPPIEVPRDAEFYDALGSELSSNPPPARDDCALRTFARAGIEPGAEPSTDTDQITRRAVRIAPRAGARLIDRAIVRLRAVSRNRHNGWDLPLRDTGRFGLDYANRAVIARGLLAANVADESLYPGADVDAKGRRLRGKNRYVIRFRPGQIPPARAFWSLTLYNPDFFLVDNPIDRYAIGDRTPALRYGRHGSLRIYIQHDPPGGRKNANWLPAPRRAFLLRLRLFEPKRAALDGRWEPPRIKRIGRS